MKSTKLLLIALDYFAKDGYEGASLSQIAAEAGIKKPSIYAHFSGKDDLFLSAMKYALDTQRKHLAAYFSESRNQSLEASLIGYFKWFIQESQENEQMKFILRVAYFPPVKLEKEVGELISPFIDNMQRHLTRVLRERERIESILYSDDYSSAALAFLTVSEGTMTEFVYSGVEGYEKRLNAVWPIFWRGLVR
ncbi:TetR/AcrR family transcriptional regulator [Planococcus sp. YIM B11945]|uniref:TetR/AcrR family transcriptional regulator n=1 Tax=Planococcus sp. YIM B11945 TaxID=3435410 RepID=UPI003D7D2726